MKRLTKLEQLSEHAEYLPEVYPVPGEDGNVQFQANVNLDVNGTDATNWPITVNVEFDVTVCVSRQQDGSDESGDNYERLLHIELVLRCDLDDATINSDTQQSEARTAIWPYCRERLTRIIRDFPVTVPELPYLI